MSRSKLRVWLTIRKMFLRGDSVILGEFADLRHLVMSQRIGCAADADISAEKRGIDARERKSLNRRARRCDIYPRYNVTMQSLSFHAFALNPLRLQTCPRAGIGGSGLTT